MIQALIGQKIEQRQKFLENGKRIPVTEVSVNDNIVVQVKTSEKDSYSAVQLGIGAKKKPSKALVGHVKKAKLETVPAVIREVAWDGEGELPSVGDLVTVESIFKPGDIIKVTGTSKGKGFAGGVKRYNFRGGPKTHGQSDRHRAPGSIGQGTTPGRVYKGKRMAGHMGVDTVTVSNLTVVDVDAANKKLYVLGLLPGYKKSMVVITRTGEQKKFVPLLGWNKEEPVVEEPKTVVEAAASVSDQASADKKVVEQKDETAKTKSSDATEDQNSSSESVEVSSKTEETKTESENTEVTEKDVKEEKKDGK